MDNKSSENLLSFKCLIVGEPGVGKSTLIHKYNTGEFNEKYTLTIGVDFISKSVRINETTEINLQIWDTAGQEYFKAIIKSFYKDAAAVFIVYNVNRKKTFECVNSWLNELDNNCSADCIKVLVGNQTDIPVEREVTYQDGVELFQKCKMNLFFETSAKKGDNVEKAFEETAKMMFLDHIKKSIGNSSPDGKSNIDYDNLRKESVKIKKDTEPPKKKTCC